MIIVTSCEKIKDVDGKNGKVAVYKVGLSDGRFGESFATQIPNGTLVEDLSIEETQWGLKFKLNKKNGFAGGAVKKVNNAAFSMAYAKDLVVADKVKVEQLIPTAEKIFTWIESKK